MPATELWAGGAEEGAEECDDGEETGAEECEEAGAEVGADVAGGALTAVPEKVEPMSPNLMLEKITDALALTDSTVAGRPELAEQVPRAIPGCVVGAVVG